MLFFLYIPLIFCHRPDLTLATPEPNPNSGVGYNNEFAAGRLFSGFPFSQL